MLFDIDKFKNYNPVTQTYLKKKINAFLSYLKKELMNVSFEKDNKLVNAMVQRTRIALERESSDNLEHSYSNCLRYCYNAMKV